MGRRIPPKVHCVECGCDMGRAWSEYNLCKDCGQLGINSKVLTCTCKRSVDRDTEWDPECEVHQGRNPYAIPF